MKKKYFEQPELMVVRMTNNDIVTTSPYTVGVSSSVYEEGMIDLAPDRRFDSWDEGY